MAVQKTYTMIKPDGVKNGHIGEIVNRFAVSYTHLTLPTKA